MTVLARRIHESPDMFQDDFAQHAAEFPGAALEWLNARRRAAMREFAASGIPNRRLEAWKYTDLANALEPDLQPLAGAPATVQRPVIFPAQENELLFGGSFLKHASTNNRIEVFDLSKLGLEAPAWVQQNLGALASGADQPMGAVSLALMRGGAAIRVHNNSTLHLNFANSSVERPTVSHGRILLVVESGVSLRLIESHTGAHAKGSLRNIGVELHLNPQSQVEHIRVQSDASDAIHVTSVGGMLGRNAKYRGLYAGLGGRLSRLDINLRFAGEGSEAVIHNVAAIAAGIADITSVMDHASPHSRSRQLFKNVVGGRGRVVNQGRVIVREGSVKSDSHQVFRALLLSPHAEADAKPELEIFADDVLCGHGTAIGALDADALFYLRSRGIPEQEAKLVLVRAFLAEALEDFADDEIRSSVWRELEAALSVAAGPPQ
jgi:Fe-S cluster assembly protein SufD